MRSCCAVYVDAGYLLASSSMLVSGTSLRAAVSIDHALLMKRLTEQVERDSGLPLLRINWYDSGNAATGRADATQQALALLPRVKVRLGRRSYSGEQKGVDLRLGLDLVTHARNRAVDVAYLLSGDDDLTEAVEEAQLHGVQVNVLAVPDTQGQAYAVARHLQMEADGVTVIDQETIPAVVKRIPRPASPVEGEEEGCELGAGLEESAQESLSSRPTPALLDRRRPHPGDVEVGVHLPADASPVVEPTQIVYSSDVVSTDWVFEQVSGAVEASPESIDAVCRSVLAAWLEAATDEDWDRLLQRRPTVPPEVDRALLRDLSLRIDTPELGENDRHALRGHFWQVVDERQKDGV
ncbi:NYN domain [Dermatophilus congolensis]|uniref:NYN domain n=1 Tax=Dermatophilus congolensis TaxID=1863 RepID=A0AA46GZF4_9MICO|nr:NYN domain-containing protein [Dermatophilus congolensis]STD03280.1 NYN domain [Dermatophilus congolensis]